MSVKENKALTRRVFDEIWSQGKLELADELLSPEFVGRPGSLGEPFQGPAGAKEFLGSLREGFPDITFSVKDMVGESDLVATRWTSTGTHDGEFMGFDPTEQQVTMSGITFLRFRDGMIVEGWTQLDEVALLKAIGAVRESVRA